MTALYEARRGLQRSWMLVRTDIALRFDDLAMYRKGSEDVRGITERDAT